MKRYFVAIVALALVVAACGGGETSVETSLTTTTAASGSTTTTAAATDATTTTAAGEATTSTTQAADTGAPSSVAFQAFQQSLADTSAVESFRMEGGITLSGIEGGDGVVDFAMPMSGEFDIANGAFTMVMDMSGVAAAGGSAIDTETAALFGEIEVRTIGGKAYMKSGFFSLLGVTTDWVSMPAEDAGDATAGFGIASPTNPMDLLAPFTGVDAEITEIGPDTVRGVPTIHYRVVVDAEKLAELADPDELATLQGQTPLPLTELPIDFWIGDDGLVYRYSMAIDGADVAVEEGGFTEMVLEFEMFDFGAAMNIETPPSADVTDSTEIVGFSGLTG